jgi:SAM-dependent methyltransferase
MNPRYHSAVPNLPPPPDDQAALWNGPGGRAWVALQELLDQVLQPFEDLLVGAVPLAPGARLLDVGCGTGSTTLAFARRLGADGICTGVDISAPMITLAKTRAERESARPTFVLADAQTHPFAPASFDAIVSRFGVMFFDDPVAAFANLRRAASDRAQLRFIAWRSGEENPFMTTAERAATPFLPELPARRPDGPGQFAFGDRQRVQQILRDSGWADIDVQPIDVPCAMSETDLIRYVSQLGPVGRVLAEADDQTRAQVMERIRPAFDAYKDEGEVRFIGACWMVGGRA